jgi:subtilase family serine protease
VRVGPDLVVSALTAPSVAGAGAAFVVTETTRNLGGGAAAASVTKIYLSPNTVLDASDVLLGSRAVPALAAGASSSATTSVTIPAGTAPGGYYVLAQADGDGVVAETSEADNANFAYVLVGPDLVVQSLTGPAGGAAGASITVNDTTHNQGGGTAAASSTRFYLSSNAALDGSRPAARQPLGAVAGAGREQQPRPRRSCCRRGRRRGRIT